MAQARDKIAVVDPFAGGAHCKAPAHSTSPGSARKESSVIDETITIPHEIAKQPRLGAGHKLVLGEMMRRQGTGTHFSASYHQIAVQIGLSRRHVIRIVDDLIKRGEVRRTRRGREETHNFSVRFSNNRNRKRWIYRKEAASATAAAN